MLSHRFGWTLRGVFPQLVAVAIVLQAVVAAGAQDKRTIKVRFVGPDTPPVKARLACYVNYGTTLDDDYKKRCFFEYKDDGYTPYQKTRTVTITFAEPEKRIKELFLVVDAEEVPLIPSLILRGSDGKVIPLPQLGDELTAYYSVQVNKMGLASAKLLDVMETFVVLDRTIKYVEVKDTPPFRVPRGAVERKREEHTVRHALSVKEGASVSAELKTGWVFVEASIRGSIERATERTSETSKTTSREVEIQGANSPLKLVWIETYRTGRAITIVNGKRHEIPFEFRDGWDLQARAVKE